jgi:hypothetical protein
VFKIFAAITFCYLLYFNNKVEAMNLVRADLSLPSDTIDINAPQPVVPADTLSPDGENQEMPEPPPRKRGSGVILDQVVDYSARDSIRFDIRRQVVHLYGDAEMKYGKIKLKASYVTIDFRSKELYATGMPDTTGVIAGNPVFEEGDQSFESRELRYNFETQKGRTVKVITEEADGFLHGDVVKIMESRVIHVQHGKYTTCDNPEPHFHITFARAKILPNDKIISSAPQLTIMGVRTPLILPFGLFPNTRTQASGVLIPSYGETNNRGFYLENGGFYWGISDYIDLSIRGTIYSRGSWATHLGSNYNKRYKYSGGLTLNYAINILGERNLPNYQRERDFRITWQHRQDPKAHPNHVFSANVNAGSSQYNRFNPTTSRDYLSNTFSSNISYSANWGGRYNFSANARHSQNTITQSVDLSLPELTFSVARFYPLRRKNPQGRLRWYEEITMSYNSNASNQITVKEEQMFTQAMFSNMKNGVQHVIPISHSFRVLKHFNLSNSINYNERWYFEKIEQSWNNDLRRAVASDTIQGFYAVRDFNYSAGLNTRLYGMLMLKNGPVTAVRHVLSPSLGFTYRPDFADPFWGYYQYYEGAGGVPVRYSPYQNSRYGVPAAGRSGALNFSLTNNLEMKVKSRRDTIKGERKISLIDNLTLSSGYDFARDSLNLSDLRISGRTRLFGQFDITYASTWSPYAVNQAGRPVNTYLWDSGQDKFLQLRNSSWNLNFNYNLSSKKKGASPATPPPGLPGTAFPGRGIHGEAEDDMIPPTMAGIVDFSVPWNFRATYSFNYNTSYLLRVPTRNYTQNLSFSGDFNLTPKWRMGFTSGYDFTHKDITYTSVDIYRDLHCWELTINWIPFGFRQSYNLTLRVKSSVLQDLKLNRRTHHLDRAFQ